tara:strand:+ start:290 stop:685 length:396 start_codon:yes stop_codon:yes gene_type:complete
VNASDEDEIDSPDPRIKGKLKKSKSEKVDEHIDNQLLNAGARANILNKQKSLDVASKAQRFDRQGLPIIKIPRSEMESPSKKSKKDDKKKVYKVTFLDKIDKDQELQRVHYILSQKKYNSMNTYDPFDVNT